jgi:hypothetical protein
MAAAEPACVRKAFPTSLRSWAGTPCPATSSCKADGSVRARGCTYVRDALTFSPKDSP